MAATITRYVLVDRDDREADYEYEKYDDAMRDAETRDCAIIEREYTYNDSSLVWTPDGGDRWPPTPKTMTRSR